MRRRIVGEWVVELALKNTRNEKIEFLHENLDGVDVDDLSSEEFSFYCLWYAKMMVWELTGKNIKIFIDRNKEHIAGTNGRRIYFNWNKISCNYGGTLSDIFEFFRGAITHEIAHILYSNCNFDSDTMWRNRLYHQNFKELELQDFQDHMKADDDFAYIVCTEMCKIENAIEDARINQQMLNEHKGVYVESMQYMIDKIRQRQLFSESTATMLLPVFNRFLLGRMYGLDSADIKTPYASQETLECVAKYIEDNNSLFEKYRNSSDEIERNNVLTQLLINLVPFFEKSCAELQQKEKLEKGVNENMEILKEEKKLARSIRQKNTQQRMDAENVEEMDDADFEEYCCAYATMMVWKLTDRWLPVTIVASKKAIGSTNGVDINLDLHSPLFEKVTNKKEKFELIKGVIFHEIAHIIYTNIPVLYAWLDRTDELSFTEPELQGLMEIGKLDDNFAAWLSASMKDIENALEDSRIEMLMDEYNKCEYTENLHMVRKAVTEHIQTNPLNSAMPSEVFLSMEYVQLFGKEITDKMVEGVDKAIVNMCKQAVDDNLELCETYKAEFNPHKKMQILTQLFINLVPLFEKDYEIMSKNKEL